MEFQSPFTNSNDRIIVIRSPRKKPEFSRLEVQVCTGNVRLCFGKGSCRAEDLDRTWDISWLSGLSLSFVVS
jgi:hypothetical protein